MPDGPNSLSLDLSNQISRNHLTAVSQSATSPITSRRIPSIPTRVPGSLKAISTEKAFRAFLRPLFRQDWVVYAKPPFGGPEHVLQYLARYTHRVAISNHRLLNVANGEVTFRWKDYAHGNKQRNMTLSGEEFLRRFLLHVLPKVSSASASSDS